MQSKKRAVYWNFKKLKKADVQISMSWIFMIIIGTFFLILAYNVISKYSHIEDEKYQIELKNGFRQILNTVGRTAGIEENSLQPIGNIFKNSRVEIKCIEGLPILSINDRLSSENEYLKNYPVFMTYIEQEKIDKTYIAVESFKLPFKITNMLALVSKKNLIIFDNNSKISKKLLYKFNKGSYRELTYRTEDFDSINKDQLLSQINKRNYNSVMFVSDSDKSLSNNILNGIKTKSYYIKFHTTNDIIGNLTYYTKNGNEYKYKYIDYNKKLSLPTMAVFSDPETFNCSYSKIKNSIVPVYSYYLNKSNYLENISHNNKYKLCSASVLNSAEPLFYQTQSERLNDVINEVKTNSFDNLNSIFSKVKGVEAAEIELEKFSCIYTY